MECGPWKLFVDASRCRVDSRLVTMEKTGTRDTAVLLVFLNSDAVAKVPFCKGHPIRQNLCILQLNPPWSGKCFVILQSVDWPVSVCVGSATHSRWLKAQAIHVERSALDIFSVVAYAQFGVPRNHTSTKE